MLSWDDLLKKVCHDRGLEPVGGNETYSYLYVKNHEGRIFPVQEATVQAWILEEKKKEEG